MSGNKSAARAFDIEVSGHETVEPEPEIVDALERDYPLEASITDIVDNSIDADARNVLIRFMRNGSRLVSLCIADDGRGIGEREASRVMQFAARRKYTKKDLGMFGVGLKVASLSQADAVIVASRARGGRPVGRQWTKAGIKGRRWSLDIVRPESALALLQRNWGRIGRISVGTVVRWDQVRDFAQLRLNIDEYLDTAKLRIQKHVGLKLHRFLERRRIHIEIDIEDIASGEVGPPSRVHAMNPFPPKTANGAPGYPRNIVARFPAGNLSMRAYIWRKKSRDEGYTLGGGSVAEHQGFYFYRHDRLIQDGGWCGIIGTNDPHMSLARLEVDIPDRLSSYIRVRSNKVGVDVPTTFADVIFAAKARDGTTFDDYRKRADDVYRYRGEQKPKPMVPPGDGIPAEVRRSLEKERMRFRGSRARITWAKLDSLDFLEIDQSEREILLNSRYRKMLLRGAHGGKTDFPLLRTLLYFVFETLLARERISAPERMRLDAITASMNAALKLERRWAEG